MLLCGPYSHVICGILFILRSVKVHMVECTKDFAPCHDCFVKVRVSLSITKCLQICECMSWSSREHVVTIAMNVLLCTCHDLRVMNVITLSHSHDLQ